MTEADDEVLLIMAQVDDAPGELMGEFVRRACALGARNVQVVASMTKKGRPGHIVYIDVAAHLEPDIAALLGGELGTWGYRILSAEHKHFTISRRSVTLRIDTGDGMLAFDLGVKRIRQPGVFDRVKAEFDDLARICGALRERGHHTVLTLVKARAEAALSDTPDATEITIRPA